MQEMDASGPSNDSTLLLRQGALYFVFKIILLELIIDFFQLSIRSVPIIFTISSQVELNLYSAYFGSFVALSTVRICLIIYIALRWSTTTSEVRRGVIISNIGIIKAKEDDWRVPTHLEVGTKQGFIGRLFHIGTIRIEDRVARRKIVIRWVFRPEHLQRAIETILWGKSMTGEQSP